MVRLTVDLIAKSRKHLQKKRGLSLSEYLKKLTHLHFSSEDIEEIVSSHYLNSVLFFPPTTSMPHL